MPRVVDTVNAPNPRPLPPHSRSSGRTIGNRRWAGTGPALLGLVVFAGLHAGTTLTAQPFDVRLRTPALDRWMYPHNATPGSRPTAPVFGTLGDDAGVDSRHGQFLVGFELSSQVPTNLGPNRYLVRRCRVSATVSRDRSFVLDPTTDGPASYLPSDHPGFVPDTDPGRPIELFGVGYRNGFNSATFFEDSPFGGAATGQRNAYAAGFDVNGALVDVGNSVGKTNAALPAFEAFPFAVGTSTTVAPGELVPAGTVIDFELNLEDPLVARYVQEACHTGRLRFMLTSLQTSGFGGQPAWAEFHTRESVLGDPPSLLLAGTAVRPEDADGDQLPDDWEVHYFGTRAGSASSDEDHDGLEDRAEWEAGTDPTNREAALAIAVDVGSASGAATLRFRHTPGRHYDVLVSRDLRTWDAVNGAALRYALGSPWAAASLPFTAQAEAVFFRIRATPIDASTP